MTPEPVACGTDGDSPTGRSVEEHAATDDRARVIADVTTEEIYEAVSAGQGVGFPQLPVPADATLTADQLVALLTDEQRYAVKAARSMTLLTLLMVVGKIKADALAQRAAADPKTGWPSTGSNPSDAAHPAPGGPPSVTSHEPPP